MGSIPLAKVKRPFPKGRTLKSNLDLAAFGCIILFKVLLFNRHLGMAFPQGLVACALGSVLLLLSILALAPLQKRFFLFYTFDWLITIALLADLIYYRYFGDMISLPVLKQIGQTGAVRESIFSLIRLTDGIYLLDLLLLLPFWPLGKRSKKELPKSSLKTRLSWAFLLFLTGGILVSSKIVDLEQKMGKNLFTNILDQTFFVQHIGILNFHLFDLYNFSKKQLLTPALEKEQLAEVQKWFEDQEKSLPPEPKYFGMAKGKNLIVVQVEALQGFVVNRLIEGQEITPNLNQLLNQSLYFPNYFYQTAQGNTSDAEFVSQVSFYPAKQGAAYFQYAQNHFYSLAKRLKEQGYNTLAMHAYKPSYWNRASMYRSLGFDIFLSQDDFTQDELVGWGLGDVSFLRQAARRLKSERQPFYTFLVTLSSHHPYQAFAETRQLEVGKYEGSFLGNYLKAIHYADEALGSFIQELKECGLWDNSVVVIYGDHSGIDQSNKEELLEFLDLPSDELTWACLQKVPLFIHLPGGKLAGNYEITGGQLDLLPTLLNLLGLEPIKVMGQDLLNAREGRVIFRNGSFINDQLYYFSSSNTIYDLASGKELPLKDYQQEIQQAQKALWISDLVLEHDMIKGLTN